MPISVMIVEDEPELLRRFSEAISSDPALHLAGAVSTGQDALAMLEAERPDVLLVDLGLPDIDGTQIIRRTAARHPDTDILVITMFADDDHVLASIEAGASGYLLKDTSIERIVVAVREIRNGGSPISPTIARKVLTRFRSMPIAADPVTEPAESPLSPRETEVLKFIAKGFSFDEVGEHLGISSHTVVTHVKKIYRKLAVHSRSEAVYEANQLGLL